MQVLDREPVDVVTVTTSMDNSLDLFIARPRPARRAGPQMRPLPECSIMTDREVSDALIAEHGFSMLVIFQEGGASIGCCSAPGTSPTGS